MKATFKHQIYLLYLDAEIISACLQLITEKICKNVHKFTEAEQVCVIFWTKWTVIKWKFLLKLSKYQSKFSIFTQKKINTSRSFLAIYSKKKKLAFYKSVQKVLYSKRNSVFTMSILHTFMLFSQLPTIVLSFASALTSPLA